MANPKEQFDRIPIILRFAETAKFAETYGFAGTQGFVALEGQRFVPHASVDDGTVFIFMHPSSTLQLLPMPAALASAGLHVICAGSRYPKNDSALIMEKVCYDLGQYVRWAKEVCGYRKVVLVGWSGGGSLSLFYQSQAESPSVTHTPAGDEYDLVAAKLIPADGVAFIAAHLSRAETLTEWLDPSVQNELDPDDRNLELDIYHPDCPNKPPFTPEFVARFRAAQLERSRRITAWVEQTLARLKARNDGEVERGFVVHRTNCDVRWIDPGIDPNGRKPNHCYLGSPALANSAPAGLARFTTLRSWLSQWSIDRSQAKGPASAARVRRTPVLQIENGADDAVPATHNPTIFKALATPDKEMVSIHGATHYYLGQPEQLEQCITTLVDWCRRKQLLAPSSPPQHETAAAELMRQHELRQNFAGLGGALTLADAAQAYQVQDAYVQLLLRTRQTTLRGYKIALTTPAMREMVGFHDSISGRLLADQILPSEARVAAASLVRLLVEFEIAFEMAHDLPARATPWTGASLLPHVACAYPAIEIVDDRNADYASLNRSILTLAADNAWNQGLVLGAPVRELDHDSLRDLVGIASIDGREVGRGSGRDVLGHPLDALAWLANHVLARGQTLRRGDLVTTGSLVKSQFPKAGQQVHFGLPGFGEVSLSVV